MVEIPNPRYRALVRYAQEAVYSRVSRVPGVMYELTREIIASELRELRNDVDAALRYISELPERQRREAAYEFFAAFFDHYLPKKFLRHYVYGGGRDLVLTEQEMIDTNPIIFLGQCSDLKTELDKRAAAGTSSTGPVTLRCLSAAGTGGTLGQFTVIANGTLDYRGVDDWELKGKMSFYDEWNFDPKDFAKGGRTTTGELKSRFANQTLPGDSFKITSPEVDFTQSSGSGLVTWKGGTPVGKPDRIGQLDVSVAQSG